MFAHLFALLSLSTSVDIYIKHTFGFPTSTVTSLNYIHNTRFLPKAARRTMIVFAVLSPPKLNYNRKKHESDYLAPSLYCSKKKTDTVLSWTCSRTFYLRKTRPVSACVDEI
jgi:hypothetical protein